MRRLFLLLTLLALSPFAQAQGRQFTLKPGESKIFHVKSGARLALEARIEFAQPAGAAYLLEASADNRPLGPLLNKAQEFTYADGRAFPYASPNQIWNLFYSADFRANNEKTGGYQVLTDAGQAYRYEWQLPRSSKSTVTVWLRHAGIHQNQAITAPIILRLLTPLVKSNG